MKMYKGFDKDLKCRGFQFEVGKAYHEDKAFLCNAGFHACENPLDVFSYYPPGSSRYCTVTLDGVTNEQERDSKRCGTDILVGSEIKLSDFIKLAAATTGSSAHAKTEGKSTIAVSLGINAFAAAPVGEYIVLVDWRESDDGSFKRYGVKAFYVDGETVKGDTYYTMKNGQLVEEI